MAKCIGGAYLCALLLSAAPIALNAEELPLTYDRIDLAASAHGEAANDMLVAVLFREREGPSAAPAATEVNATIAAALERVKRIPEISAQTLGYSTQPIYQKDRVTGWRVRQSIRLEARNTAALSNILGELQRELALESIGYQVSPERRSEVEEGLIAAALKAFQRRAELVTRELGRSRYRIVSVRIDTGSHMMSPVYSQGRVMAMDAAPPPPIEAGQQPVEVSVSGTIELQTP